MPARVLPDFDALTAAELVTWLDQPKQCAGPCGRTLTNGHFELTTGRGKPMLRTQCKECMKSYQKGLKVQKNEKKKGKR